METLGIGIVGCGSISETYMRNADLFGGMELRGCADLVPDAARLRSAEYGVPAMGMDELLASAEIDLVLNLTVPAAHFGVTKEALSAGKHVFTEKPLGVDAAEGRQLAAHAVERGRKLGSAPDTFLGAAGRRARRLVDEGAIGEPILGTAFMFGRGMEHWHPNPQFYYQPGAGPVLDMGPYYLTMLVNLLGPVRRVTAVTGSGRTERLITAGGPFEGTRFPVGTPTTALSLLRFASGALVTFGASWDVFRHSNHAIELHGTEGSLRLPDPDTFGGVVSLSDGGAEWRDFDTGADLYGAVNWPFGNTPTKANYRMLGVADFVRSILEDREPRASGTLALHVLEIMEAILVSGAEGTPVDLDTEAARPPLLTEDESASFLRGGGVPE